MIKVGDLVRWKPGSEYWGYYYENKPPPVQASPKDVIAIAFNSFDEPVELKKKYIEWDIITEKNKELELASQQFQADTKNLHKDRGDFRTAFAKLRERQNEIDNKYQTDSYPYNFITVEKLQYNYKLGSTIRKGKTFWKVLFTNRSGKTSFIWVEESSIEPTDLGGYDPRKKLLEKFLERKKLKAK